MGTWGHHCSVLNHWKFLFQHLKPYTVCLCNTQLGPLFPERLFPYLASVTRTSLSHSFLVAFCDQTNLILVPRVVFRRRAEQVPRFSLKTLDLSQQKSCTSQHDFSYPATSMFRTDPLPWLIGMLVGI